MAGFTSSGDRFLRAPCCLGLGAASGGPPSSAGLAAVGFLGLGSLGALAAFSLRLRPLYPCRPARHEPMLMTSGAWVHVGWHAR